MRSTNHSGRRGFLHRLAAFAGVSAAVPMGVEAQGRVAQTPGKGLHLLPPYARMQDYKSLKQSSHDPTGGNADRWPIRPGATQELFNQSGAGLVTHI